MNKRNLYLPNFQRMKKSFYIFIKFIKMLPDLWKSSESNNINFLDVGCNIMQLFFMKKKYKK